MNSKTTTKFLWAAFLWLVFIMFTVSLLWVDVQPAGPQSSMIGMAAFNMQINDLVTSLGQQALWDKITDALVLAAMAIAACFALTGLVQLVKGRSLKKVSPAILLLGIFYILMVIFYMFFEKVVINYRPVLVDGVLEASYPSSHTFVALFIFWSAIPAFKSLVKNKGIVIPVQILLLVVSMVMIAGRVVSGMHWATDIVGAVLLAASAEALYSAFLYWWS